ncbi:MAG: DUF3891 family protein, partial [Chthoniobacterales bacterium]
QENDNGSVILINQSDHAKLSGLFAAHWGNSDFDVPHPWQSTVRAAMFHDAGWYAYETTPRLLPDGKPMGFTQVPIDDKALAAYQWATDWMAAIDPYAGALTRKHRNGIYLGRYDAIAHPVIRQRDSTGPLKTFLERNEIVRKREESALDSEEFAVNYQLLQVWDFLSLYFCMRPPREDYIEPVPRGYDDIGVRMDLKPLEARQVLVTPWPFNVDRLPVGVVHRLLPTGLFADEAEFRRAFFQAPLSVMQFELVRGG